MFDSFDSVQNLEPEGDPLTRLPNQSERPEENLSDGGHRDG